MVGNRTITIMHMSDYKGWNPTAARLNTMNIPSYPCHWMSPRAGLDVVKREKPLASDGD
jgi:hypothetical protein